MGGKTGEFVRLRRFWELLYQPDGSAAMQVAGEALPPTLEGVRQLAEEATAEPEGVKEFLEVSLPGGFELQGSVVSQELMGGRPWIDLILLDLGDATGPGGAEPTRLQVGLSVVSGGAEWQPMEAYYSWFRDVLRRFRLELVERQANALREAVARLEYGKPRGPADAEISTLRAHCQNLIAAGEGELRRGEVGAETALHFLERAEAVRAQCWEMVRAWETHPGGSSPAEKKTP